MQPHVRRLYDRLAPHYDLLEAPLEWLLLRQRRRRLLTAAQGRVLEVGVGTGRTFRGYPAETAVIGVDGSFGMLRQAWQQARRCGRRVLLAQMDAEDLAVRDASFDTVVCMLTLCTVHDPERALAELRRVVRPGGRILLLEHVRSTNRLLQWLQDVLTPWQVRRIGCHLNRDTAGLVARSGLRLERLEREWAGVLMLAVLRAGPAA